ncbi:MAG: DUF1549 and DUF1553 domain-containing protein, partial [Candidatus Hydrogenedentota bacterium]
MKLTMPNPFTREHSVSCIVLTLLLPVCQWVLADSPTLSYARIEAFPSRVELSTTRGQQQIVVTGFSIRDEVADVTREVSYTVADPSVLSVSESGRFKPISNGTTEVLIQLDDLSLSVPAQVTGQVHPERVSFDHQTLPILAKLGCSGGACHGAPHGKAGFQLSLFASDPAADRLMLVRKAFGRRVNTIDPEQSLLLQKPTMRLPHQGGKRLARSDDLYLLLRDWIGEGCTVESDEAKCVGIDVFPATARVLRYPANVQQFTVRACFSDGSVQDVTHLAKFSSSDENVADVSPNGLAVGNNRGEAAIIIRYLEFIQTPMMTFVRSVDGFKWSDPPTQNYVDERVDDKLRQLQYLPSTLCGDEVFVRRVYLDVIGLLPTPDEVSRFVGDHSEDKRPELIDELLERPEYARFWAQKWGDLLRISRKLLGTGSVHKYNRWLRGTVTNDLPYDQFAAELLASSGSTFVYPGGNYYRTALDTNDAMETTAQLFLGSRIQCAKCHNHPFERWTQDNYYGLAAFFSRIGRVKTSRKEEYILVPLEQGEVQNPRNGQNAKPWVPVSGELDIDETTDRRKVFVRWLTSRDNPFFARVEVNRIWAQVMGRGIVEPFDDFRDTNPPANAPLLDALASDFIEHGYSRKHILRTILNSRTYQSRSRPNEFNRNDVKYFSHYQPRRLTAEQLVDALGRVTGRPQEFALVARGTKATWLPAPDLKPHNRAQLGDIEFLKVFGQPERQSVCECDRGDETSLGQALELLNGQFVNDMLVDKNTDFRRAL